MTRRMRWTRDFAVAGFFALIAGVLLWGEWRYLDPRFWSASTELLWFLLGSFAVAIALAAVVGFLLGTLVNWLGALVSWLTGR